MVSLIANIEDLTKVQFLLHQLEDYNIIRGCEALLRIFFQQVE